MKNLLRSAVQLKKQNLINKLIKSGIYKKGEYCRKIEPAVRSFEPLFADDRASKCEKRTTINYSHKNIPILSGCDATIFTNV